MRSKPRRFLSVFLLATYASVSILGEGLHLLLADAEHQHHHGRYVYHSHDVEPSALDSSGPAAIAKQVHVDSHLCEICAFLFEAVSPPVEADSPIESHPLIVAAAVSPRQPIYTPTSLGPQAARGPPLRLAYGAFALGAHQAPR